MRCFLSIEPDIICAIFYAENFAINQLNNNFAIQKKRNNKNSYGK